MKSIISKNTYLYVLTLVILYFIYLNIEFIPIMRGGATLEELKQEVMEKIVKKDAIYMNTIGNPIGLGVYVVVIILFIVLSVLLYPNYVATNGVQYPEALQGVTGKYATDSTGPTLDGLGGAFLYRWYNITLNKGIFKNQAGRTPDITEKDYASYEKFMDEYKKSDLNDPNSLKKTLDTFCRTVRPCNPCDCELKDGFNKPPECAKAPEAQKAAGKSAEFANSFIGFVGGGGVLKNMCSCRAITNKAVENNYVNTTNLELITASSISKAAELPSTSPYFNKSAGEIKTLVENKIKEHIDKAETACGPTIELKLPGGEDAETGQPRDEKTVNLDADPALQAGSCTIPATEDTNEKKLTYIQTNCSNCLDIINSFKDSAQLDILKEIDISKYQDILKARNEAAENDPYKLPDNIKGAEKKESLSNVSGGVINTDHKSKIKLSQQREKKERTITEKIANYNYRKLLTPKIEGIPTIYDIFSKVPALF